MIWHLLQPNMTVEHLGFIPSFLDEHQPGTAKEQIDKNYIAGWNKFNGFELDHDSGVLTYPDDPPLHPIAVTMFHREMLMLYPYSWFVIMQPDGSWEVARLD